MSLLVPLSLFALVAIAIPVLVHLVRREDRQGHPFPSIKFLQQVPLQVRQRRKLRHPFLLLLRCLAIGALALGFATPFFEREVDNPSMDTTRHNVIIAIDRSYSMQASARWVSAVDTVTDIVNELQDSDEIALVAFDSSALVISEFSTDRQQLLSALRALQPRNQGTVFSDPFNLASRLFKEADDATVVRQSLIVVSDLQASAFGSQTRLRIPQDVEFSLHPVTDSVTDNLAIMSATVTTAAAESADGSKANLLVSLANTGTSDINDREFSIEIDGQARPQQPVSVSAGQTEQYRIPVILPGDRVADVQITIGDDDIKADNTWYAVLTQGRNLRVALVVDDAYRKDAGVFVRQALELAEPSPVSIEQLSFSEWVKQDRRSDDVVILDDVAPLSDAHQRRVFEMIENGRGVVVVAASHPSFSHTTRNNRSAEPVMLDLQPAHIGNVDPSHPMAQVLDRRLTRALVGARIYGYQPLTVTADDQVVATLDNGAPLLVERSRGSGRLLIFTTTLDPRLSSLALEPGFVPLMIAAIDHVAQRSPTPTAFSTGATVDLARYAGGLPGAERWRYDLDNGGSVIIETPSGQQQTLRSDDSSRTGLTIVNEAGFYEAHGGGQSLSIAVNTAREESSLEALSVDDVTQRINRVSEGQRSELTPAASVVATSDALGLLPFVLLIAALLLFIVESWLANRLTQKSLEVPAA